MPQYALSTFGRTYVTNEELQELPTIRKVFAVVTGLVGIIALVRFIFTLTSKKRSTLKLTNLPKSIGGRLIIFYILSHLIHSIHFVDNILRPVDYFEPKWLYQKYLISEMEITFFVNFPIVFTGLYFMEKMINGMNSDKFDNVAEACRKMTFYILGSLLTVGHYRIEPPWKYEPFVNFTIAGEGIATIILAVLLYKLNKECKLKLDAKGLDAEDSVGLLEAEGMENTKKFEGVRSRTPLK